MLLVMLNVQHIIHDDSVYIDDHPASFAHNQKHFINKNKSTFLFADARKLTTNGSIGHNSNDDTTSNKLFIGTYEVTFEDFVSADDDNETIANLKEYFQMNVVLTEKKNDFQISNFKREPNENMLRTALNISAGAIYDELYSVCGDQAPSYATVKRWTKWFREGGEEIEDEARLGRPVTETTFENIEQVRLLIDDDPHITIEEVQEQTDLSHGTVQRIITDHLKLKKAIAQKFQEGTWRLCDIITGDESWFYHTQIGRKSSNAAWSDGPVLIHPVKRGQTIDHDYYIKNCLRPLVDEIKRQRPSYGTSRIKIHHDNGRPHIHEDASKYLESERLTIIQHPPNSPDLSPCDFWLFDLI
ncbi:unnamed protein product [Rotaria sordida]|uniref:Transposase n=1 Tax=Rotaria sordida TaxID=392033 RepID=A0A819FM04_9BILA|nr:unnamed protein product [Rotaria sordida]